MVTEIFTSLKDSLIMTSSFCIFMFCCIVANTILGAVIASKTEIFDKKVLLHGIVRNIGILIGVDILSVGFAGLAKLIKIYGIVVEYNDAVQSLTTLSIVAIIITLSYKVYGKQALDKLASLGNLKSEEIVPIERAEGWEQRGK